MKKNIQMTKYKIMNKKLILIMQKLIKDSQDKEQYHSMITKEDKAKCSAKMKI